MYDADVTIKKKSQLVSILKRFSKNKLAMFGMILFLSMCLVAIFANIIVDYDKQVVMQNMAERLQLPSKTHLFGTDAYGRDMFGRIIYGARISLFVGIFSVGISLFFGAIIGASAGYFGGMVDNVVMRIMDIFLAIPSTLMAIAIVAALGQGMINLLIALSISNIPRFSRVVRSAVLSVKGEEYIEAAKAFGTSNARIIARHILPNAIGPIIVQATLSMASAIIAISSLSYVGLGIEPPTPEWGSMLADAKAQMRYYPHLVIIPGIAIVLAVLALNLIGDGLRDALDPKLKN